jgi:hypothetical protein
VMVGSRAGGGGAIFGLLPSCMCMHGYGGRLGCELMIVFIILVWKGMRDYLESCKPA